jgi:hypothetical protein
LDDAKIITGSPDDSREVKLDIPVAEPEASEADELLEELAPRLEDSEEERLANRVMVGYHAALQDRTDWESRLAEDEDQYYNRAPDKYYPWPGAANFHVPITMSGIETLKPKLVEAVLGQNPPIMVVPVQPAEEERKDRTETFLNWQITTELNVEPTVAQSAHLFLLPGTVVAKTYWLVRRVRRKMVREFPLKTDITDILQALFGQQRPATFDKVGDLEWEGTLRSSNSTSEDLSFKIKMKALETSLQVLFEREELVERPQIDLIEPPDFIAPARGGQEIAELPWCQHRLWLTEDDLRRKVDLKRFYADAVQALLDQNKVPGGDSATLDSQGYKQGMAKAEGIESEGPSNARRDQWEILEDYRRWDIDGDGLEEEIICWVSPRMPGRILGWDYLDNVYAHGRRPFRKGCYFPIPFRFHGLSYAEVVKGIQDEVNTIHNQRVDYNTVQNVPITYYRASMSLPPTSQTIRPGDFVPVDNPSQDLAWPKFSGNQGWASQEEQTLQQILERLTGETDLSLGRQPNRVGATRTAAGTQTLLGQAGLRFKMFMDAFQRFWIGIFEDILALDQEYLPPGKEFRVTGKRPEFIRLKDRTEIRGRYSLKLAASDQTMNREKQRQDAALLMQATLNPSLIQVGLVGLKGIRRVLEKFYKAYGEDPDFILEPKAVIRSPEEELAMFVGGKYVSPVQGEDVQRHLMTHQAQMMDPDIQAYLKPEVHQMLRKHIQETMQVAQAMQMAQMMAQQGGKQGGQGQAEQAPGALQAGNQQTGQAAPQPNSPAMGGGGSQATNLSVQGVNRGY